MQKAVMEQVKNAGWRRVQRRRNRNGSICTRVSDLRFDVETRPDGARGNCVRIIQINFKIEGEYLTCVIRTKTDPCHFE